MVRVLCLSSEYTFLIKVDGHATGSVELCAGISAIVQALDGWLHESGTMILLEEMSPGKCILKYRADTINKISCATAFALTAVGLSRLAATEPEKMIFESSELCM